MLLQGTDGFHKCSLEAVADRHHFPSSFHLCGQGPLGTDELVKGKSWQLYDAVIQHWFKAGHGLPRNGIGNLIQGIANGNLCRHTGDGVAGSFGSQGRGTAYTGIHLYNAILKAFGMQSVLDVAAAGNVQLTDDIESRGPKHLVFFISQGLRGSHYDAVSCMDTYGINIFHITYGNAVACTVPHDLIFDLFPACNAPFYKNLSHTGKSETICKNLLQFLLIAGDSSAASSQSIGRT